jgi:hypothetical protein
LKKIKLKIFGSTRQDLLDFEEDLNNVYESVLASPPKANDDDEGFHAFADIDLNSRRKTNE